MNAKKFLSIILALALVFCLAACSDDAPVGNSSGNDTTVEDVYVGDNTNSNVTSEPTVSTPSEPVESAPAESTPAESKPEASKPETSKPSTEKEETPEIDDNAEVTTWVITSAEPEWDEATAFYYDTDGRLQERRHFAYDREGELYDGWINYKYDSDDKLTKISYTYYNIYLDEDITNELVIKYNSNGKISKAIMNEAITYEFKYNGDKLTRINYTCGVLIGYYKITCDSQGNIKEIETVEIADSDNLEGGMRGFRWYEGTYKYNNGKPSSSNGTTYNCTELTVSGKRAKQIAQEQLVGVLLSDIFTFV